MVNENKEIAEKKVDLKNDIKVDGLGSVGPLLSHYHVGDIAGILGLVLTIFTFTQARAAKSAALRAANAAIKNRDKLELATRLAELTGKLRVIRDVYRTDDWSLLELTKDHAVAIAVEVKTIDINDKDLIDVMERVALYLREIDPDVHKLKDDAKRNRVKATLIQRTNKLADDVEEMKLKRVKNGT